jgi:hypothetical protein
MRKMFAPLLISMVVLLGVGGFAMARSSISTQNVAANSSTSQAQTPMICPQSPNSRGCGRWHACRGSESSTTTTSQATFTGKCCGNDSNPQSELKSQGLGSIACLLHGNFLRGNMMGMLLGLLSKIAQASVTINLNGTWTTYTADQGNVTAISPTSITIHRLDGVTVVDSISSNTKYLFGSSATVGERVIVVSESSVALYIIVIPSSLGQMPTTTVTSVPGSAPTSTTATSNPVSSLPCLCPAGVKKTTLCCLKGLPT